MRFKTLTSGIAAALIATVLVPMAATTPAHATTYAALCASETLSLRGGYVSATGMWTSWCESDRLPPVRYKSMYDFSLSRAGYVTIDLESDVDTYLFLLEDRPWPRKDRELARDDDGGSGTNSRITYWLRAGNYRIEATTYHARQTGTFTLHIRKQEQDSAPTCGVQLGQLSGSVSRTGWWTGECESDRRPPVRYARIYEFSLSRAGYVTIDLESNVDTYLYLLEDRWAGSDRVLAEDDDGGRDTNSRITYWLEASNYRIEATTYHPYQTGSFILRIRTP